MKANTAEVSHTLLIKVLMNLYYWLVGVIKSVKTKAPELIGPASFSLTVHPPHRTALAISSTSVVGRSITAVQGGLTIDSAAPNGSVTVSLASSNTSAATIPDTVVIGTCQKTGTFTITTNKVTSSVIVILGSTSAGVT